MALIASSVIMRSARNWLLLRFGSSGTFVRSSFVNTDEKCESSMSALSLSLLVNSLFGFLKSGILDVDLNLEFTYFQNPLAFFLQLVAIFCSYSFTALRIYLFVSLRVLMYLV